MARTAKRRDVSKARTLKVIQRSSAAAGSAQPPEGSVPLPQGTQADATIVVVHEHGASGTEPPVPDRILTFAIPLVAKGSSQILIGWVPGRGSDPNATAMDAVVW